MSIIYGVDITKPITPHHVRDAIVECFAQAHREDLEQSMEEFIEEMQAEQLEKIKKENIERIVRNFFTDVGGDYENPNKDAILGVLTRLKQFVTNFNKPEILDRHYDGVMALVDKL